jgi:hypothetical protein
MIPLRPSSREVVIEELTVAGELQAAITLAATTNNRLRVA